MTIFFEFFVTFFFVNLPHLLDLVALNNDMVPGAVVIAMRRIFFFVLEDEIISNSGLLIFFGWRAPALLQD